MVTQNNITQEDLTEFNSIFMLDCERITALTREACLFVTEATPGHTA